MIITLGNEERDLRVLFVTTVMPTQDFRMLTEIEIAGVDIMSARRGYGDILAGPFAKRRAICTIIGLLEATHTFF
jgi:hypothetical protein